MKNRSNIAASILQNPQILKDAYESSKGAEGSAQVELDKYLDSIEGKVQQFKNELQETLYNLVSSETVKGIVSAGTAILNVIGKITDSLGGIGTLITAITTAMTIKSLRNGGNGLLDMFKSIKNEVTSTVSFANNKDIFNSNIIKSKLDKGILHQLNSGYNTDGSMTISYSNAIDSLAKSYNGATAQANALKMAQDGLSKSTVKDVLAKQDWTEAERNAALTSQSFNNAQSSATAATSADTAATWLSVAATKALTVAKTALRMATGMVIGMLISTGISAVVKFADSLHKTREELKETADEIRNTFNTSSEDISTNLNTISELEDEFSTLSKGVSTYGENISLTTDEYTRYKEIVSQIVATNPLLVSGYNDEGEAIANKNTLLEESIRLLKEKQRVELQEYVSDDNIKTLGMDVVGDINDYMRDNPLEYGNAKMDFMNVFSNAAERYDSDNEFKGNYELFKALSPDGYDWNDYGSSFVDAKNFASDYFDQIVEDLRSEESVLRDYFNSKEVNELLNIAEQYDKNIAVYDARMSDNKKAFNPTLQLIPQVDDGYEELSDAQKSFITSYINGFELSANTTEDELISMKYKIQDFVSFVQDNEIGGYINDLMALDETDFNSADEYILQVRELINKISEKTGMSEDEKIKLQTELGFDIDLATIKNQLITVLSDNVDNIGTLTLQDLQIAYKITADLDPSSISWEELINQIDISKYLGDVATSTQEIFDDLDLTKNIFGEDDKFSKSIDGYIEDFNYLNKTLKKYKSADWTNRDLKALLKEYPELAGETENLEEAIESLLDTKRAAVRDDFFDQYSTLDTADERNELNQLEDEVLELSYLAENADVTIDITIQAEDIAKVNAALQESISATGMTADAINNLKSRYQDLEGYNAETLFEKTANGIRLNRQEFNKLENSYKKQNMDALDADLEVLVSDYNALTRKIVECRDAKELEGLYSEREGILTKIEDTKSLISQYEGLTSAYKSWQDAEASGSERDMYETILSGLDTMDNEISRGWIDDGSIELLELLSGKTDLATASTKKLKEVYEGLDKEINKTGYSVRDFFTVNEDGESTNTGVYNFLETVESFEKSDKFKDIEGIKNLVKRDKKGNIISFDFSVAGGDQAIADALGISEELVQIMLRAADDAGFVVSLDGTWKQLDKMQEEADIAATSLKELSKTNEELKKAGGDFEFDFTSTNVETLTSDLEKAKNILNTFKDDEGNIDLEAPGAKEALTIVSTLQANLDSLNSEKYGIGLTVEDEKFKEPLEKLQEYGRKIATLNQLEINPNANTEEIEAYKAELEEISKYFAGLDEDTKIKLGFEADDNWQEVQSKIEAGEVKIPTTLDLQVKIGQDVADLKKIALLNSGLLSEEQEEIIKVDLLADINIEPNTVDDSNVDEKVEETVNGGSGEKTESTEKTTDVIVEAGDVDTSDVEEQVYEIIKGYTPEEQKILIEYFAETKNYDATAEEINQAIVEDKIVQFVAEDEATPVLQLWNTFKADPKFATLSATDQATQVIQYWNSLTVEQKEAYLNGQITITDNTEDATANANANLGTIPTETNTAINVVDNASTVVSSVNIALTNLNGKTANTWVVTHKKTVEEPQASGTLHNPTYGQGAFTSGTLLSSAHADGTAYNVGNYKTLSAYAGGNVSLPADETALVNELGTESIIRDGKWMLIPGGMHMESLKKGDIILSAQQTEDLLKHGKTNGHARAYASGTLLSNAYGGSSGFGDGWGKVTGKPSSKPSSTKPSSNKKSSNNKNPQHNPSNDLDKSNESAEKFSETIDWIEIKIERLERAIDNLDTKASRTWKSWSYRTSSLVKEIAKVEEEIAIQEKAAKKYQTKADSIGLAKKYVDKIKNGTMQIETIKNEETAEKIKEYQEWYEKALACKDAILELQDTEMELYKTKFDNLVTQYEGYTSLIEHEKDMLDAYISQAEESGYFVSTKYYDSLIKAEEKNIDTLAEERRNLLATLHEIDKNGISEDGLVKDSEDYYDLKEQINDITLQIEESNSSIIEYNNNIREIEWEVFDYARERVERLREETEFLIGLMEDTDLFDETGNITDTGMATMGLYAQNYNAYMAEAEKYAEELKQLENDIAADPNDKDAQERYDEVLDKQREMIDNARDQKNAIKDLVEEGINKELEALDKKIEKYQEAANAAKDLYDYQKNIEEQTSEIASLEKQMSIYQNDDSEEGRAKKQQLQVQLDEARQNLEETEMDRVLSETDEMLTNLKDEYSEVLNERLDNVDKLLDEIITQSNENADNISKTLSDEAAKVGYTISDELSSIWNGNDGASAVLSSYGNNMSNQLTSLNIVLNQIAAKVDAMVSDSDSSAQSNIKNRNSSTANDPGYKKAKKTGAKTIKKGGQVKANKDINMYSFKGDKAGFSQYFANDPIYTVLSVEDGWIQVRHHSLNHGVTGWFNKKDVDNKKVKAYATGGLVNETGLAWLDGTKSKPEMVLNATDTANLRELTGVLRRATKEDFAILEYYDRMADLMKHQSYMIDSLSSVFNQATDGGYHAASNNSTGTMYNEFNMTFELHEVQSGEDVINYLIHSNRFENAIQAMTVDRLVGGSKFAKSKYASKSK